MKTRIKLPTSTPDLIATRDEAEFVMNDLATTANNQRRLMAKRDAEVLAVNAKYEADLAACAESLKDLTEQLHVWAETNPDAFEKGRKSITMTSGTLGFRTGNPKLGLFSRAFTWDKVLELVRSVPGWVRTKEEVAKDVILAEHASHQTTDTTLRSFGMKVTQDEGFFVEPDLSQFEPRQTVPS